MVDDTKMDGTNPAWRRAGRMVHITSTAFQMAQSFMNGQHDQFVNDGAKLVELFARFYPSAKEAAEDIVQFSKENGHGIHVIWKDKEGKDGDVSQKSSDSGSESVASER